MGQALKPAALVVEDDDLQRELMSALLEESDLRVIECDSAEDALRVLDRKGEVVVMVFADVRLAGAMSGAEFVHLAKQRFPSLAVIVTSGYRAPELPGDVVFMQKPWRALDVLREAARVCG